MYSKNAIYLVELDSFFTSFIELYCNLRYTGRILLEYQDPQLRLSFSVLGKRDDKTEELSHGFPPMNIRANVLIVLSMSSYFR